MALTDNLVSYWRMEEPGLSNRYDLIGTNNFTVTAGVPSQVSGKSGFALHGNGINSYLTCPYTSDFALGNNQQWTWTAWVKIDRAQGDTSNGPIIITRGPGSGFNPQWQLMTRQHTLGPTYGELSLVHHWVDDEIRIEDFADTLGSLAILPNEWHFVAFGMQSDGKLFMQIDCYPRINPLPTHTWTKQYTYDTIALGILLESSGLPSPSQYFAGAVDEVGYWTRELTSGELTTLCAGSYFYPPTAGRGTIGFVGVKT